MCTPTQAKQTVSNTIVGAGIGSDKFKLKAKTMHGEICDIVKVTITAYVKHFDALAHGDKTALFGLLDRASVRQGFSWAQDPGDRRTFVSVGVSK